MNAGSDGPEAGTPERPRWADVPTWLLPGIPAEYVKLGQKAELADRLGIRDEALELARTTVSSFSWWVDQFAVLPDRWRGDVARQVLAATGADSGARLLHAENVLRILADHAWANEAQSSTEGKDPRA